LYSFLASKPLRSYNSKVLLTLGITAGLFFGIQNSTQRFIGLRPNDSEIKRFGVASDDRLERFKKHTENPNLELIDSEISKP